MLCLHYKKAFFFILEFLEKATNDTAEKFYLSVFKTFCSITDTSIPSVNSNSYKDFDGYKTKIMDILISDTQSECRKKLLSHFNALYNSYESLQFFSKKHKLELTKKMTMKKMAWELS